MISEEMMMKIRHLHDQQRMGIREITRKLDVSRNTVRRYLRGEVPDGASGKRKPGRPRALEGYEQFLRERVKAALPHRIPATVLTRELAAMGFKGTERTVRRFVAPLYDTAPESEPIIRYETAPGHQAQMDWSEHRLAEQKLFCFVGLLGYSRYLYFEYVDSMKTESLLACHHRMLAGLVAYLPRFSTTT